MKIRFKLDVQLIYIWHQSFGYSSIDRVNKSGYEAQVCTNAPTSTNEVLRAQAKHYTHLGTDLVLPQITYQTCVGHFTYSCGVCVAALLRNIGIWDLKSYKKYKLIFALQVGDLLSTTLKETFANIFQTHQFQPYTLSNLYFEILFQKVLYVFRYIIHLVKID